jgi:hypothetical protein
MFLLRAELPEAMEAFGMKFADILARRRVVHGPDPFAGLAVPSEALRRHLGQALLNLALRLRERYVLVSRREEQLAVLAADFAGPLRASAAALLQLEGHPAVPPKEALARIVEELGDPHGAEMLRLLSRSREEGSLPPGEGAKVLLYLLGVAERMRARAAAGPAESPRR